MSPSDETSLSVARWLECMILRPSRARAAGTGGSGAPGTAPGIEHAEEIGARLERAQQHARPHHVPAVAHVLRQLVEWERGGGVVAQALRGALDQRFHGGSGSWGEQGVKCVRARRAQP